MGGVLSDTTKGKTSFKLSKHTGKTYSDNKNTGDRMVSSVDKKMSEGTTQTLYSDKISIFQLSDKQESAIKLIGNKLQILSPSRGYSSSSVTIKDVGGNEQGIKEKEISVSGKTVILNLPKDISMSIIGRYTKGEDYAKKCVENGDALFLRYSSHGMDHIISVIDNATGIMAKLECSEDVSRMVTLACLYHDTGMANNSIPPGTKSPSPKDNSSSGKDPSDGRGFCKNAEATRNEHHFLSGVNILNDKEMIGKIGIDPYLAALTAFSHSKSKSGLSENLSPESLKSFVDSFKTRLNEYEKETGHHVEFDAEMVKHKIDTDPDYYNALKTGVEIVSLSDAFTHSASSGDMNRNQCGDVIIWFNNGVDYEALKDSSFWENALPGYSLMTEKSFTTKSEDPRVAGHENWHCIRIDSDGNMKIGNDLETEKDKDVWLGERNADYSLSYTSETERIFDFNVYNSDSFSSEAAAAITERLGELPRLYRNTDMEITVNIHLPENRGNTFNDSIENFKDHLNDRVLETLQKNPKNTLVSQEDGSFSFADFIKINITR